MVRKRPATFLSVVVGMWLAFFAVAHAESIQDFNVAVELEPDGSFVVTETILYDFEDERKRGIYRNVKDTHAQPATSRYKDRYISLDLISVKRDGQSAPYNIQEYDGLSVRIGDPDVYLTGTHEYEIKYQVDGAIAIFDDFDEFYWNVTGAEWSVPIEQARVELTGPPGVLIDQYACYAGRAGTSERCLSSTKSSDTRYEFTSGYLAPGEQFTVAQQVQLLERPAVYESTNWFWFIVGGIIAWFGGLIFLVYRWRTRYKTDRPVIAQYEPLSDFKPMYTGVLLDGRLDPRDIAAGLVYLAEQGFITIKEVERKVFLFSLDDYEVTLKRPISEAETEFHKTILNLLFGTTASSWQQLLMAAQSKATGTEDDTTATVGSTVSLSMLRKDQTKLKQNAREIRALKKAVKKDLVERGYFEQRFGTNSFAWTKFLRLALFFVIVLAFVFVTLSQYAVWFFHLLVFSSFFLIFAVERRTRKGYEAKNYLEGFKEFLGTTEKERYTFHNAPSKNPEQFMEYLPYAIAFGVEKEWAEVFADIEITNPDWYQSASGSQFNTAAFSQSISAFSSSFSTSSGSSGSSGGGSSGGGSGGGGGGSW